MSSGKNQTEKFDWLSKSRYEWGSLALLGRVEGGGGGGNTS